jgi:AraC family transcriptional regulator
MKPSATGRILIWRGGSLWIGRAGAPADLHAHHAVQIALPFAQGAVRFQVPTGEWTSYSAAIVAAEQPHAFDARDQRMATIFVDPESRDGRRLQTRYRAQGVAALDADALRSETTSLADAYERHDSDDILVQLARAVIARVAGSADGARNTGDPRVALAMDLIRARLSESISLASLATAVNLSPDRLRHLFAEETGVGLRPYVLWLRLETSLSAYVAGSSLTDAAYAGGFADSAHFSRTFKKMFGISPASVRPE